MYEMHDVLPYGGIAGKVNEKQNIFIFKLWVFNSWGSYWNLCTCGHIHFEKQAASWYMPGRE